MGKDTTRSDTPLREEAPAKKTDSNDDQKKQVEAMRAKMAAARAEIGLKTQPLTAIRLSIIWAVDSTVWLIKKVLKSPLTWLLGVPLAAAWGTLKYSLAPHLFEPPVCGDKEAGVLWWAELAVAEVAWWMILGILSSIGFGTGLHSGLMFLFPHVMQVVGAAEGCQTANGLITWYNHPCKLDCSTTYGPKDSSSVTIVRLWSMVTMQCMLWGIGTAMGELPPYLVSKAARLGGTRDDEFEEELEKARQSSDVFSRLKIWTIDFTQKHGFLGVFLLASWPNAAFDMCGMCCGYLLMPFWTFFLATCLGKGVMKVNGQAFFFVILFGSGFFRIFLSGLDSINGALTGVLGKDVQLRQLAEGLRGKLVRQFEQQSRLAPEKFFAGAGGKGSSLTLDALKKAYVKNDDGEAIAQRVLKAWDTNQDGLLSLSEVQAAASRADGKVSLSSLDPGKGTSILKMCWELFIVGLVFFFLFSVINQVARSKQQELDEAELQKLEKDTESKKEK